MIKPISLKTKKDKWGNSVFSFTEVFPVYERTSSLSLREKALSEWKEFLEGKRSQLTHKYIAVLAAIIPENYPRLLDYIFTKDVLDEEIALILFRQLHPFWDQNPYFEQLLQLGHYIKTYNGNSSKIKHLQDFYALLFQANAPKEVAAYFHNRLKEQWLGQPRTISQIKKLETILQDIYTEVYKEKLPEPDEINKCVFPLVALTELFKETEPELSLVDNFTHDFIINPTIAENQIDRKIFRLAAGYIHERRKSVQAEYSEQLCKRYIAKLINMSCNRQYLKKLEEIACTLYNFYPVDYQITNNLPDREFITQILENLITGSWSTLLLCENFMQDLRLISCYPTYDKIIGQLISSHRNNWQANNEKIKVLYLGQLFDKYIQPFAHARYNAEYLRMLENLENNFKTAYYASAEKDLYNEMARRLIQKIIDNTWDNLQLCECKAFITDFRLRPLSVHTPILATILANKTIDKINVLIQYIFAFEKERLFEQLNETADAFAQYVSSYYNTIQQRNERAGRILLDYYNLQKIIKTFTGSDQVAIERRDFWTEMRKHATETFKVYQAADRLLFLASFGDKLVLDSTKYAEACYVFYDTSADFLAQHIQDRIRYSASNVSPVSIAKSLYGHRSKQIRHVWGWQQVLKYILVLRSARQ